MMSRRFLSLKLKLNSCSSLRSFVTANVIKDLRQKSGAPMMECKKALMADGVNGDLDLAMDWLRAKGIARAGQSNRVSKEGLIAVAQKDGAMLFLEVNCETDYLSLNSDFQKFVISVSDAIINNKMFPTQGRQDVSEVLGLKLRTISGESKTVHDALGDIVSTIRENIAISRAEVFVPQKKEILSSYVHGKVFGDIPDHIQLGKVGAMTAIQLDDGDQMLPHDMKDLQMKVKNDLGHKLAMHVVVAKPEYLDVQFVPGNVIEREKDIFREQMADENKKPEMLEKILNGKISKRLNEICLLGQSHLAEEGSPIVRKHLDSFSGGLKSTVNVTNFRWWSLGQQV